MSVWLWLLGFFAVILLLSLTVYVLVVKFFYWGDKDAPPVKKRDD
jgi:hypothetical protein